MTPNRSESVDTSGPLRRWFRHYTRGLLLLISILVGSSLVASIWPAEEANLLWAWVGAGAYRWVIVIAAVLLLPALLSWVVGVFVRPFLLRSRGFRTWLSFERDLVTELAPDEESPVAVVLVNWPSAEIRSVGVLTSEFSDPETGDKLASVFIPRGPNMSRGDTRVVRRDSVQLTDWTLPECLAHQWSFGAAVPRQDEP